MTSVQCWGSSLAACQGLQLTHDGKQGVVQPRMLPKTLLPRLLRPLKSSAAQHINIRPLCASPSPFHSLRCRSSAGTRTVVREGPVEQQLEGRIASLEPPLVYVSFYHFASLPDYEQLKLRIKQECDEQQVAGGIIVAPEGINGSICGTRQGVNSVLSFLRADPRFAKMRNSEGPGPAQAAPSTSDQEAVWNSKGGADRKATPFQQDRVHVKIKKEVIPLGVHVDPTQQVGTYVKAKDWNALLTDPDTIVVDVRNEYETRIGKFKGAVEPHTLSFRDFPEWVDKHLLSKEADPVVDHDRLSMGTAATTSERRQSDAEKDDLSGKSEDGEARGEDERPRSAVLTTEEASTSESGEQVGGGLKRLLPLDEKGRVAAKGRKVAMYCTGGIRCEKSTSLLLQMGFKEVFHLEGGILEYLQDTPPEDSLWEGECFVFDRRTSVKHGMKPGSYSLCFACKEPLTQEQQASPLFLMGVQCPLCADKKTERQKERDRQRQMQFERYGLIGGVLKPKPSKSAAEGTRRDVEEGGRVGGWVNARDESRRLKRGSLNVSPLRSIGGSPGSPLLDPRTDASPLFGTGLQSWQQSVAARSKGGRTALWEQIAASSTSCASSREYEASQSPRQQPIDWSAFRGSLEQGPKEKGQNCYSEPNMRELTLVKDGRKIRAGEPLFHLAALDWVQSTARIDRIASRRENSVMREAAETPGLYILVINMQLPGQTQYSMVFYFACRQEDIEPGSALHDFINGSDALRNKRFKFTPRISEGSWFIRQAVGERSVTVADALGVTYSSGHNFLEIDVNIGSSPIASSVFGLVMGVISNVVIDFAFVLEAVSKDEWSEELLGAVRLSRLQFSSAVEVPPP